MVDRKDLENERRRIHYHRKLDRFRKLADCEKKLMALGIEFSKDDVLGAVRVRAGLVDLFFSNRGGRELYGHAPAGSVGGSWRGATEECRKAVTA